MQLLAKFKQILYMGFHMYRIALNVSLNLSICYSFRHVLKPGTPEHRNTPEYPGTPGQPKKPGAPNLTVLFCFPITDHVKNLMSMSM